MEKHLNALIELKDRLVAAGEAIEENLFPIICKRTSNFLHECVCVERTKVLDLL